MPPPGAHEPAAVTAGASSCALALPSASPLVSVHPAAAICSALLGPVQLFVSHKVSESAQAAPVSNPQLHFSQVASAPGPSTATTGGSRPGHAAGAASP